MLESVPLYLNWSFWAVAVALLAVALSQLPPVAVMLKQAKLEIEVFSRIVITHKVGNPIITLHVILNNIGGRRLRVRRVNLQYERDGENLFTLPLQNYYEKPDSCGAIIFTPFTLKPGEEWSHSANFLNFFNREDEKRYKNMESVLRQDIQEKKLQKPDELVEADPISVEPLLKFFAEKFPWKEGEYTQTLTVHTDQKSFQKKHRFLLFESESEELRARKDGYRYGAGVFWEPQDASILGVELHEVDA